MVPDKCICIFDSSANNDNIVSGIKRFETPPDTSLKLLPLKMGICLLNQ